MTALDRLREIRATRLELAAFAEAFASTRKDGETWETNGYHFERRGGKTRRVAAKSAAPAPVPVPTPAPKPPADDEDEYEYSVNPHYGKDPARDILRTVVGAGIGGAAGGPIGAVVGGGVGFASSKIAAVRAQRRARKMLAALPPGSAAPPPPKSMPSRWRARVRRAAMEYWPKIVSIPTMLPGLLGTAGLGVLGTLGGTPAAIMLGSIGAGGLLNKAMDRGAKKAKAVRLAMAKSPAERRRAQQRNKDAYFSELRNLTAEFVDAFAEYESFSWEKGQRGGRYWLPPGKRDIPANRLYGDKAEKAANAGKAQAAKPGGGKKGPRPGEAERIARAKFEVARDAVAAASQPGANVPADRLAWLKARMDSAERDMRAPAAPVASAPLSSLPAVAGVAVAPARTATATATSTPSAPPKTVRADPYTVLRQPRTEVGGSPIVAINPQKGAKPVPATPLVGIRGGTPSELYDGRPFDPEVKFEGGGYTVGVTNSDGTVHLQLRPRGAKSEPIVMQFEDEDAGFAEYQRIVEQLQSIPSPPAPRTGGTPDVRALAKSVDAAITGPTRAASWGYDFTKARETLASATREIDDYARTQPRKVAALAREVTGQEPTSTEHAVKLLKDFVAESVDLLDKSARGGRSHQMSERVGGLVIFLDWLASRLA